MTPDEREVSCGTDSQRGGNETLPAGHSLSTELDYGAFPVTRGEWLAALVREDDGTFECVPAFMRPYIRQGWFEPDGRPLRPGVLFGDSPLSFARFMFAFDLRSPKPPWSGGHQLPARLADHVVRKPPPARDLTECPTRVYFIAVKDGPIKIGISNSPQARLTALQTASPFKLEILATCVGDGFTERHYHQRFAAHRLSGEWFERTPEILAEIERISR